MSTPNAATSPAARAAREALARDMAPAAALRALARRGGPRTGRMLLGLALDDEEPAVRARAAALLAGIAADPAVGPALAERVLADARDAAFDRLRDPALSPAGRAVCERVIGLVADPVEVRPDRLERALVRELLDHAPTLADHPADVDAVLGLCGVRSEAGPLEPQALVVALLSAAALRHHAADEGAGATAPAAVAAGAALAALAAAREHGLWLDAAAARSAVRLAVEADPARAAALLDALAAWPAGGPLGELAREARAGLTVAPAAWPAASLVDATLTGVDALGWRTLCLDLREADGSVHGVALSLGEPGLARVAVVWDHDRGLCDPVRRSCEGLHARVGLPLARALVAGALARNEASGRPVPGAWLLVAHLLGDPIAPAPRGPDLAVYDLARRARDRATPARAERALAHPAFARPGFASREAYAWVAERLAARRGPDRLRLPLEPFLDLVERVEKASLEAHVAANLEVLALACRSATAEAQAGADLLATLRERLVPWRDVGFVRAVAQASLARITLDVDAGFASREEVARASAAAADEED